MARGKYIRETKQFTEATSAAGVLTVVLNGHHGHEGTIAARPGYADHFRQVLPDLLRRLANEIEQTPTTTLFVFGVTVGECGVCDECRREQAREVDERPLSSLN